MPSLARPSSDLSCADLLSSWLPAAFAQARAAGATPPDVAVAIDLTGDGGGAWTLRVAGGQLAVTSGVDPTAPVVLRQRAADLRAAIWGEGAVPSLVPAEFELAQALTGQAKLPMAALAPIKGTLQVEVPAFAGRTWAATITLGGAATPSAAVSLDLPTIEAMRAGILPVGQALFTGKIAISGDVAWLMQVGMSVAGGMGGLA